MKICYYQMDEIDSTSDWAKRRAQDFVEDTLYVMSAKSQTKGHGRFGRAWVSPPGKNILVTLAFVTTAQTFCCCQLVALVVEELLREEGIEALIKWPNDLLVNGKKIAGILAERVDSVTLIGIGLNVNMSAADLGNIPQKATSMGQEMGHVFDLEGVLARLVALFIQEYENALASGFQRVSKSWHEKVQWMISHSIAVQTGSKSLKGHLVKLALDGTVELKTDTGEKISIQSGDIQLQ
jgi:BirA family transcriptional regulator, biotin operon repressor / biotin---[acetyl-CoA-carboxylase] ligase